MLIISHAIKSISGMSSGVNAWRDVYKRQILHHRTIADFVFRFKLPFKEETMFEQEDNFWKYLESLKK